jgi:hypothetical protein
MNVAYLFHGARQQNVSYDRSGGDGQYGEPRVEMFQDSVPLFSVKLQTLRG